MDRFTAVQSNFRACRRFKGETASAAKGWAFVHLYAVYEYTVRTALQVAIDAIISHERPFSDLKPSVLALFLDPAFTSVQQCKNTRLWEQRIAMLEKALSSTAATVGNGVMPMNGTHYRYEQLQLIFKVLGIKRRPIRKWKHRARIDELVEKRNAISHGRDTAENVGRQLTRKDIDHRMRQIKSVCLHLIAVLEEHTADPVRFCRRPTTVGFPADSLLPSRQPLPSSSPSPLLHGASHT